MNGYELDYDYDFTFYYGGRHFESLPFGRFGALVSFSTRFGGSAQ